MCPGVCHCVRVMRQCKRFYRILYLRRTTAEILYRLYKYFSYFIIYIVLCYILPSMQKKTTISDWSWLRLCARQNIFFFLQTHKRFKRTLQYLSVRTQTLTRSAKGGPGNLLSVKLQNDNYTTVKRLKTTTKKWGEKRNNSIAQPEKVRSYSVRAGI